MLKKNRKGNKNKKRERGMNTVDIKLNECKQKGKTVEKEYGENGMEYYKKEDGYK